MAIAQHCRLPEVAPQIVRFTACQNCCPFGDGVLDMLAHFFHCGRLNQRPDNGALLQTITHFQVFHGSGELADKGVIYRLLNIEAVDADADLARVAEFIGDGPFHRGIDIGILKDDVRRITAQLHRDFFHGLGGIAYQRFSYRRRAGKGDFAHLMAGHDRIAYLRGIACDRVKYAVRDARLFGEGK